MINYILLGLLVFSAIGCGQNDKRLKEKTKIEGDALKEVENTNLFQKAESMERDLQRRHRFFQAIKGNYEGTISTKSGNFNIRVTLSPSLPPVTVSRVRQLEEIASDLNNLTLNTQVVQWDPNSANSAVGCRVTNVRPNIEKGELTISAEGCPNLYQIKIADRGNGHPMSLASQILNGSLYDVDSLTGQIQPSTNANIYKFTAYKTQE